MERLLLRPPEAADVLGISRSKLYDLISRGELKVVRIDGAARVPARELERFVAARLGEADLADAAGGRPR